MAWTLVVILSAGLDWCGRADRLDQRSLAELGRASSVARTNLRCIHGVVESYIWVWFCGASRNLKETFVSLRHGTPQNRHVETKLR
jgi:hypothetical protein